ncbi:MAG: DUF4440 domain-containing protein [Janthinobacterium lividum]
MRLLFVMTALLLAAGGPVSASNKTAAVQKTLQADYDARDKAVAQRDINATLLHYASDFTGVSSTGKAHDLKEERLDFLKTFSLPGQSNVTQTTLQKLTLDKAGAVATVMLSRHGVLHLVDPQTHAGNVVVLDGTYQDIWAKHSGDWLLTREQAISVKATMNGKPL